jgi:hypothetical protein
MLSLIPAVSATAESDFFTLYGLEIPAMKNENWLTDPEAVLYSRDPINFDIRFFLNESGQVDSLTFRSRHKAVFVEKLKPSLMASSFYAAKLQGVNIPFIIPAVLTIHTPRGRSQASLTLPYDERACTRNRRLVEKSMELNGWELPQLKKFPSYFVALREPPSLMEYPYAVFRISLDSLGRLKDYEQVLSYGGDFQALFENPLLYAVFSPLRYRARGLDSEIYIVFRLFDVVNNPTAVWPASMSSQKSLPFEALRIEVLYFRDSILNRPIPYNLPDGLYSYGETVPFMDTVRVEVELSQDGDVIRYDILEILPRLLEKHLKAIIGGLRFTPARNWQNEREGFQGFLEIAFDNSKNIRVVAEWLPRWAQIPVIE